MWPIAEGLILWLGRKKVGHDDRIKEYQQNVSSINNINPRLLTSVSSKLKQVRLAAFTVTSIEGIRCPFLEIFGSFAELQSDSRAPSPGVFYVTGV